MKKIFIVLAIAAFGFASCQTSATKEGSKAAGDATVKTGRKIKTQSDTLSYALAVGLGEQLKGMKKDMGDDLNMEVFFGGIRDVMDDKYTIDGEQANAFLQNYFTNILPAKKKEAGEKFLANVEKTNPNVKKTESGLMYDIIEPGSDAKPTSMSDKVRVMYKGMLKDGTEFDSSYAPGRDTTEFALGGVIKGWGEGLQLIGEGGKIKLWIPYDLAYGERGYYNIGPYEPLVFEVELFQVMPAE